MGFHQFSFIQLLRVSVCKRDSERECECGMLFYVSFWLRSIRIYDTIGSCPFVFRMIFYLIHRRIKERCAYVNIVHIEASYGGCSNKYLINNANETPLLFLIIPEIFVPFK